MSVTLRCLLLYLYGITILNLSKKVDLANDKIDLKRCIPLRKHELQLQY